jgi:hypothetical protein
MKRCQNHIPFVSHACTEPAHQQLRIEQTITKPSSRNISGNLWLFKFDMKKV